MSKRKQIIKLNSPIPVRGSVALMDEQSPALTILVTRLEEQERQLRLMNEAFLNMKAALADRDKEYHQLQQTISQDKARSAEAIKLSRERLLKTAEANPIEPHVQAQMIAQIKSEGEHRVKQKRAAFTKLLEVAPKGVINNPGDESIPLMINGVKMIISPGKNVVPAPFAEEWEKTLRMAKWAESVRKAAVGTKPFHELEQWRGANSSEPDPLMWQEE